VVERARAHPALAPHGPDAAAGVSAAPRPPAAGVLPPGGDAVVAAARSASGEPPAGTSESGNTVDSNAAAGRHARSPCADKRGAPADACWRKQNAGWYTGRVPRESPLPAGPSERFAKTARTLSFGPLRQRPTPLRFTNPCPSGHPPLLHTPHSRRIRRKNRPKETEKDTS